MQNELITLTYFYFIDQLFFTGAGEWGIIFRVSEIHAGFLS